MAKILGQRKSILDVEMGSKGFIAPEISSANSYSRASDIYALGIIFKEQFFRKEEIPGRSYFQSRSYFRDINRLEIAAMDSLIQKMTDIDPAKRPNIEEVFKELNKIKAKDFSELKQNLDVAAVPKVSTTFQSPKVKAPMVPRTEYHIPIQAFQAPKEAVPRLSRTHTYIVPKIIEAEAPKPNQEAFPRVESQIPTLAKGGYVGMDVGEDIQNQAAVKQPSSHPAFDAVRRSPTGKAGTPTVAKPKPKT